MIRVAAVTLFRIAVHAILLGILTVALSCLFAAAVKMGRLIP